MPRMDRRIAERPLDLIALDHQSVVRIPPDLIELASGADIYGVVVEVDPEGDHWIDTEFGLLVLTQSDLASDRIDVIA